MTSGKDEHGGDDYDGYMDAEVIAFCDALNAIPGITTTESCCGHGRGPFKVWFRAKTDCMPRLLYYLDS